MSNRVNPRNFLLRVGESKYHLLPDRECFQEDQLGSLKSIGLLRTKFEAQQDGSRMKVIYSPTFEEAEIARRLMEIETGRPEIFLQTVHSATKLEAYSRTGRWKESENEYLAIWMHTFLNGARVIPILACDSAQAFYDLSCLFPSRIPEDEIGILVDYDSHGPFLNDIRLPGCGWKPTLVPYQSKMRLCHCCGIVSDISKPRKHPWKNPKNPQ